MAKTTVAFQGKAESTLAALAEQLDVPKADVLRNALSLYAYVLKELQPPGRDLAIVHLEDVLTKIAVPGFWPVFEAPKQEEARKDKVAAAAAAARPVASRPAGAANTDTAGEPQKDKPAAIVGSSKG
jgi:hypothetical protein